MREVDDNLRATMTVAAANLIPIPIVINFADSCF